MITFARRAGEYCDVAPGVLCYTWAGNVICEGEINWAISDPSGQPPSLNLRCARNGAQVLVVTKHHETGEGLYTINGSPWRQLVPDAFGPTAFLAIPVAAGFRVFVMTSGTTYREITILPDGQILSSIQVACAQTSQGFLEYRDGIPRFTDPGNGFNGRFTYPNHAGDLEVGQNPQKEEFRGYWKGINFKICDGVTWEPHVAQDVMNVWRACARSNNHTFLFAWLTAPFEADKPPIDPPVDPDPDPEVSLDYKTFDPKKANYENCPMGSSVFGWPITAKLTDLMWTPGLQTFDNSKGGDWPVVYPLTPDTALNANIWIIFSYRGEWYVNPIDWLRPGSSRKDLTRDDIASNSHIEGWGGPEDGDHIGVMVSTLARHQRNPLNGEERSAIYWLRYNSGETIAITGSEPGGGEGPEEPEEPEPEPPPPYPDEHTYVNQFKAVYNKHGRGDVDAFAMVWWGRVMYDWLAGSMTLEDAMQKHLKELDTALGG